MMPINVFVMYDTKGHKTIKMNLKQCVCVYVYVCDKMIENHDQVKMNLKKYPK